MLKQDGAAGGGGGGGASTGMAAHERACDSSAGRRIRIQPEKF